MIKVKVFTPIEMDAMDINYSYLDQYFSTAMQEHQVLEGHWQKKTKQGMTIQSNISVLHLVTV